MNDGTYSCPICTEDTPHSHRLDEGRWIGVDFDGTLAKDSATRGDAYSLGPPIAPMVSRVKEWLAKGYTVKLLTARMYPYSFTGKTERDLLKMEKLLKAWCLINIGQELECTCSKDGKMEVLWDDRAVRVKRM